MPDDAPTGLLVDYLKDRGILVYEGQDDLSGNEAFEHLARHLGTHFKTLANFYEKVKRCVATGRGQRIDIDGFTPAERSAAVQFGTLLHRHGMLKDFYYHRSPKKQLRVIPTKDGQVGQFLTGGWLEIYVSSLLSRRLRAAVSPAKYQLLYNVKGALPDGREFEADVMAAVDGRLFWLECKTGNWQDYSARFRGLVPIFGVDRKSGGLLLIKSPDAPTRARATDMLDMALLSLDDVDRFVNGFLGIEGDEGEMDHAASGAGLMDADEHLELGEIPPLSEDEIPLENAEPAKKLGKVDLEGGESAEAEAEDAPRRRRRRRRGGRGRRGRGGAARAEETTTEEGAEAAPAAEGEDAPKRRLHEPVAIEPIEDEEAEAAAAPSEESGEESAEAKPKRRRRRRRSSSSPFAEGEEAAASEDSEESAPEKVAEEKPAMDPLLAAMVAAVPEELREQAEEEPVEEEAPEPEVAEAAPEPEAEPEPVVAEAAPEPEPDPLLSSMVASVPSSAEEAAQKLADGAKKAKPKKKPAAASQDELPRREATIAPDLASMMAGGEAAEPEREAEAE